MSLKMDFVHRAVAPGANVSALCREYNVSRQTAHKWINRFKKSGYNGLEEQSRRPRGTPLATAEDLVVAIVESREAHPTWGQHTSEVLIGIAFSDIEIGRSPVPFLARLIDVESQPGARATQIRSFGYFEDELVVQFDSPATASFYVSQEDPVIGRGVMMRWLTLPERGSL